MKRIPLPAGATINSDSLCFTIDSVLGHGANCIVYNAHYDDRLKHRKEVIIKECYPVRASVSRQGNTLSWNSIDEMQSAFDRMQRSYDLASEMQDSDVTRSASVYTLDKISANGTQYIIMIPQHGHSYDKDKSTDIANIIRTVLALCNAVGLYHQAGYLHLDIKPSNFIATTDHTGKGKNIALFDLDTLVALDDIQSALVAGVSYTKEWAAPEQKQMQIAKLCLATDLYAIGAILFERIMHRMPTNADMSPFATWEYDDRFNAKKVNPKAKRLLTDIFHKTLSANVKRRYQYASDLSDALGELLNVVCSKAPYIISSIPATTCNFIGRTEELNELEKAIKESDSVFVSGSGGIGKTELVKQYITLHKDEYDAVVFMVYNTTVTECLAEVIIYGDIGIKDAKINVLKQLCDGNTLFVLDNFDVSLEEGNEVNSLLGLHSKVIITTRTDFSDIYQGSRFLTLHGLPVSELNTVFEKESGLSLSWDDEKKLSKIYHLGESCTYFWTMIARLTKTGAYSIAEIVKKVLSGLDQLEETERVIDTKDSLRIKRTVAKAMSNLFKLEGFAQADYEVLKTLYYLDNLNLSKRQFKDAFALCETISVNKLMNAFNSLLEKGYIERFQYRTNDAYRINEVLKNVLEFEIKPSINQSMVVSAFIENKLIVHKLWLSSIDITDSATQEEARYYFRCLFSIIQRTKWDKKDDAEYCVNLLYDMFGGEAQAAGYAANDYSNSVFRSLFICAMNQNTDPIIRVKAFIVLCSWSCHWVWTPLLEEFDDNNRGHIKDAEISFNKANEIIAITLSDDNIINDLCRPFIWAFLKSKKSAQHKMFSGALIDKILDYNPLCLRDTEVTPQKSFRIVCLLNEEYEAIYLGKALMHIKTLDEEDTEQYAYITIGRILLNGCFVNSVVPEQLRKLRKEVFSYCKNRYFDSEYGFPRLDDIDPLDFAPDPICMPKQMTIGQSILRFRYSITKHDAKKVDKKRQKELEEKQQYEAIRNEHDMMYSAYPVLFDNKGNLDISLFYEAITQDLSSDALDYIITEYRFLVDYEILTSSSEDGINKNLSEEEINEYIELGHLLKDKVDLMVNEDSFQPVIDDPDLLKDSDFVKAEVDSVLAVIFAKIENTEEMVNCMNAILFHSKNSLYLFEDEEIIEFKHGVHSDFCFWGAFNRIKAIQKYYGYSTTLLIEYSKIVADFIDVDGYCDRRMYNYYKEIVRLAKQTIDIMEAEKRLLKAIFNEDTAKFDERLQFYQEIADTYTYRIEEITGQEYHP